MDIIAKLAEELNIRKGQAQAAVQLIDEGNTIPFISRYRKEVTGSLNDEVLRNLFERLNYLRNLEEKKEQVLASIEEQGLMTDELREKILAAKTQVVVDDLYRPFRPKRRTRASIAKEKGLEPLAELILQQLSETNLTAEAEKFIDDEKGVESAEDAIAGASDIIAEQISDDPEYRKIIRELTLRNGIIVTKASTEEDSVYSQYYDFSEAAGKIAHHRLLAVNRGEKEGFLSVKLEMDSDIIFNYLLKRVVTNPDSECGKAVKAAAEDSYSRLIEPSVATEIRNMLTEEAQERCSIPCRSSTSAAAP